MPQTTVSPQPAGFPGMLADASIVKHCDTGVSEEASASIPFGVMVKKGTGNEQVKLLTAQANVLRGIAVYDGALAKDHEVDDAGIRPFASVNVLQRGRVWVYSEEAVNPSLGVKVRCVAISAEIPGSFRVTSDSTDCVDISKYAKWKSTTTGAGPAILEIDMNNSAEGVLDT